jgi:hypothetical protein
MLKFVAGELNDAILNNKESDDDSSSMMMRSQL